MIIIIKDGYDVIDNRPEAEIAQSERDYFAVALISFAFTIALFMSTQIP